MRKVFVDTNILIDLIADRKPFSQFAIQIFANAEAKKLTLFASSHSIATTHYLLKKYVEEKQLREILLNLTSFIEVIPIDMDVIKKGLKSKHKDFEDALQIICASTIPKLECIVTRNTKDFKESEIEVLSPDQFCVDL
jgi:predicted nucleic acid-binding protein